MSVYTLGQKMLEIWIDERERNRGKTDSGIIRESCNDNKVRIEM
jgi:hypothetical protein